MRIKDQMFLESPQSYEHLATDKYQRYYKHGCHPVSNPRRSPRRRRWTVAASDPPRASIPPRPTEPTGTAPGIPGGQQIAGTPRRASGSWQRDPRLVERRRDELAFVHKADMHCRRQPYLKWAAEKRGLPVSGLPEHAAWLAEGAALEETGRRMRETPGFAGRISAALGRIAQGFKLDEGGEVPRSDRPPRGGGAETGDRARRHGEGGAARATGGGAGAPRAPRSRSAPGPWNPSRLPRKRCTGCAPITRRPTAGSRRSCRIVRIAWRRPGLQPKSWPCGSTRRRRCAARDCGCSARAKVRNSAIKHGRDCPARRNVVVKL